VVSFTATELREDIDQCIDTAVTKEEKRFSGFGDVTQAERDELRKYMTEFLADVDRTYPLPA